MLPDANHPAEPGRGNVAAVDIGTNSVRLLVTDAQGRELERVMRITRLGQGVDVHAALHPDAIARTLAVLSEYGTRLRALGAERVRAAATSAARDATNGAAFLDAAERALGARPELLSGEQEAALSFRGATAGLPASDGPFLVIDIGGGSTEFVLGHTTPLASISLQVGCVRMTERHLTNDPPSRAQLDACVRDVRREVARVRDVMDVASARRVIGLAGTVTALSALALGLDHYDASRTHGSVLTAPQIQTLFERLAVADLEARRAMLAEPERAEVIVGGAAVLVAIVHELSIPSLIVSEKDILDGLAASLRTS